jgi:hypothetical protein
MNLLSSLRNWVRGQDPSAPPALPLAKTEAPAPPYAILNGVPLTKEEWDVRVARLKVSPRQQRPIEPAAAGHTLKLLGFWAPLPHWYGSYHHPSIDKEPPWPDVRRAVRAGWRSTEREPLVAYLRHGHRWNGSLGFSACRFACRDKYSILGSGELTDGEWVWPEGLPHYVERHSIMLPEEFVASAAARGWQVPPIDQVGALVPSAHFDSAWRRHEAPLVDQLAARGRYMVDHSLWLEWGKALPNVPEAHSSPDARVLERFCLTIKESETDESDPQTEGFEESVWDKLRQEYGRYEDGLGCADLDIEWIAVKHRDLVVAQALDGLRRYALTDRVQLVAHAPDPNDWQRDRAIAVWPQGDAAEPWRRQFIA